MFRDMFRDAGFEARRGQQFSGGTDSPDVVVPALPDFHWEIKFCQVVKIKDWMAQAVRDAGHKKFPVVGHKRNNEEALATLRFSDLLTLISHSDFVAEQAHNTTQTNTHK